MSGDALSVSLTAPLAWDHPGGYDASGTLRYTPHVANLTRNVVLRSQNPDGTRGHAIFISSADVDIRYAEFDGMGRTTNAVLDSTTRDGTGIVTHVGTNQIGRYPLHLHYCNGVAGGSPTGYQFRVVGNSIDNGSTAFLPAWGAKWGIDVHHSHYGLIQANVVYDSVGAGITTEDGSESHNLFDGNFTCKIPGDQQRGDLGLEGSGLWFRGVNNSVTNNVAAGLGDGSLSAMKISQLFLSEPQMTPSAPGVPPSVPVDHVDPCRCPSCSATTRSTAARRPSNISGSITAGKARTLPWSAPSTTSPPGTSPGPACSPTRRAA